MTVLELDCPGSDYLQTAGEQLPGIPGGAFCGLLLSPVPEERTLASSPSSVKGRSPLPSGTLFSSSSNKEAAAHNLRPPFCLSVLQFHETEIAAHPETH